MTEEQFSLTLFALYICALVGMLAYMLGKSKGEDEYRAYQRSLLGVGTVWEVGEDGRLHRVKEGEDA